MATFKSFEEIEAWKKARVLVKEIYLVTGKEKFNVDFRLRNQIRDAATSIMANISEGFERDGNKEFCQFLYIAKASSGEVRSHLYVALDQDYISEAEFELLKKQTEEISRMLKGLIVYIHNSDLKGLKFKNVDEAKDSRKSGVDP